MTEPTDKIDEQQLDEYLKGDSSVSRQYRQLPGEQVPPSLDRLVLRQAEEAVKRPARPAWMRWTAPLAVAASAVLVVSIVIESGLRDETIVSAPAMQRPAQVQAPAETQVMEESADLSPEPQIAAPPPPASIADTSSRAPEAFAQDRPAAAAPATAPAPASELRRSRQPSRDELAGAVPQEQLARAERQKRALEAAAREQESAAPQRAMRGAQGQLAGPRGTVEKPESKAVLSYSRPISATAEHTATIEQARPDPEAWLKEIRQLRMDDKQEEADREWQRFREAFPDYEVAETDSAAGEVKPTLPEAAKE